MDSEKPKIRAPRTPWMEFLLHFSTFGVYSGVWLALRVREINRVSDTKFTPWLWFFVPAFAIAQIFALPKFTRALNRVGDDVGVRPWHAWHGGWVACILAMTVAFNVSEKVEFPSWTFLVGMLVWAGLFTSAQPHVNAVKRNLTNVRFSGSERSYSIAEWLIVVPLLPITSAVLIYLATESLFVEELERLAADTTYVDPNGLYRFPIVGDGWSVVASGTRSDGDALLELQGPLPWMDFLVFRHGLDDSLDGVSRWRMTQSYDEMSNTKCQENRSFSATRNSIVSRTQCVGRMLTDPALQTISLVETADGIYELYGEITAVKFSYFRHEETVKRMAGGFEPL